MPMRGGSAVARALATGRCCVIMPRLGDLRLLACLAGGIAALGLAPFNIVIATPLGLAGVMLFVCQAATPRSVAAVGFWGGFGYFLVALHWIVEPFLVYAAQEGWMAPFALFGLSAGLALFVAVPLGGYCRVACAICFLSLPQFLALIILALSVGEYARAYLLTGFPWAMVGHALIGSDMRMVAAIMGGHGMGLILLILAAFWAYCLVEKKWSVGGLQAIAVAGQPLPHPLPRLPRLMHPCCASSNPMRRKIRNGAPR